MLPELHLFGLTLGSYRVFACLAAAVGAVSVWPALRRAGLTRLRAAALLLATCAAFLVGARMWNVAVCPGNYGPGRLAWYALRPTGLSLYGGILGAMAALLILLRVWWLPAWRVLDGFSVPSGCAFCIARVGCFLNGCCKGVRTDGPLGVVFPSEDTALKVGPLALFSNGAPVHPTQLYELAGAALGLPLCRYLAKRWRLPEGGLFLLYGVWLSAVRLAVLPLRALNYAPGVKSILYPALYLGCILLGVLLLLRRKKQAPS